jgi:hypothetical protein
VIAPKIHPLLGNSAHNSDEENEGIKEGGEGEKKGEVEEVYLLEYLVEADSVMSERERVASMSVNEDAWRTSLRFSELGKGQVAIERSVSMVDLSTKLSIKKKLKTVG